MQDDSKFIKNLVNFNLYKLFFKELNWVNINRLYCKLVMEIFRFLFKFDFNPLLFKF